MSSLFRWLRPEWLLRWGLGLMYLYSGYDLLIWPQHWYGFVPVWLKRSITPYLSLTGYLRFQGIIELIIGFLFITGIGGKRVLRIAALLAFIEMALVLLFLGVDAITFRDIGLLGAAGALFLILLR